MDQDTTTRQEEPGVCRTCGGFGSGTPAGCPDCGKTGLPETDPARAASIAALRDVAAGYARLADAIEARDTIPAPHPSTITGAYVLLCASSAEEMAAAARALPCNLAKQATEKWFELRGQLAGLEVLLYAARETVCTITGYEDRPVEEIVTPAVRRTVTKPMPVWECAPILAGRPA